VNLTSLNPQESSRQVPVNTKPTKREKRATEECNNQPETIKK